MCVHVLGAGDIQVGKGVALDEVGAVGSNSHVVDRCGQQGASSQSGRAQDPLTQHEEQYVPHCRE